MELLICYFFILTTSTNTYLKFTYWIDHNICFIYRFLFFFLPLFSFLIIITASMSVILYFLLGFPCAWTWANEAFKLVDSYYSLMLDWIENCHSQPTLCRVVNVVFFEILVFMIFFYILLVWHIYSIIPLRTSHARYSRKFTTAWRTDFCVDWCSFWTEFLASLALAVRLTSELLCNLKPFWLDILDL